MSFTLSSQALSIVLALSSSEISDQQVEQVYCLAVNSYHEARGEGFYGMQLVSSVTVNLAKEKNLSICETIVIPRLFSWVPQDPPINLYSPKDIEAFKDSVIIANNLILGKIKPITVANHYYNPAEVSPTWAKSMEIKIEYGRHIFLLEK